MMKPQNIDEINAAAMDNMRIARENIRKGCMGFIVGVGRLFLEAWIVQLIWNMIIATHFDTTSFTYWEMFFVLVGARILGGQIKIGTVGMSKPKANDNIQKKDKNTH